VEIPGYKIQREIGKGGMATVYLAIQESLNRPVVLKMLDSINTEKSKSLVDRFLSEGRILASLNHPNIITIYDIGIADSTMYISMEYVRGGDLKQRLELSVSPAEALDYLAQISKALGEAHKRGIVHRDVKPANILFKDNTPVLTDFGIAKHIDADTDLTSTGIFLGSPNYVSPEQTGGDKLDGRADIYSLGCILYEMLTGKKTYTGDSVIDIIIQHRQAPVPVLQADLSAYQPLLDKMLAKKRDERFSDTESLLLAIEKLQKKLRADSTRELSLSGEHLKTIYEQRQKRKQHILIGLILISLVLFSTLKYVEIRIKETAPINTRLVSTDTVLNGNNNPLYTPPGTAMNNPANPTGDGNTGGSETTASAQPAPPVNAEIIKALKFLGRQSLDTYKLTYPPGDNAYFYFSRLLDVEPGNPTAIEGMLAISDRYAFLAEQALLNNENNKAEAYIDIGLRINPQNETLLDIKSLVKSRNRSLLTTIKNLFPGD
jgi:serine/threonine protein kinase